MRCTVLSAGIVLGLLAATAVARADPPAGAPVTSPQAGAPPAPAPKLPPDEDAAKGQRGWIADGKVGVPILKSSEFKVVASGMIGYRWNNLELILSGNVNQYSSASDNVFNNTTHASWRLNGAYVSGSPGDSFRWLVVVDLSHAAYLTRYLKLPEISEIDPSDLLAFNLNIKNEDSHMLRSSTLVGFLLAPSPRTQVRVGLGLGLQGEIYVMTMFRRDSSGTEAAFDVDIQPSVRTLGHVMFRYQLFPSALAVRLQSGISIFRLSRSSAAVKIDFSNLAASDARLKLFKYTQIESTNRLALDIEKLGFLGLMPSVFTGLDLSLLTGDIGNSTAIVPVFGIGLTNGHF